jgi:phosphatidylserine synthase
MVSTFRFWSLKALDLRRQQSYRAALPIIAVIALLAFWPERFFPGFAVAYAASGPVAWTVGRIRARS